MDLSNAGSLFLGLAVGQLIVMALNDPTPRVFLTLAFVLIGTVLLVLGSQRRVQRVTDELARILRRSAP